MTCLPISEDGVIRAIIPDPRLVGFCLGCVSFIRFGGGITVLLIFIQTTGWVNIDIPVSVVSYWTTISTPRNGSHILYASPGQIRLLGRGKLDVKYFTRGLYKGLGTPASRVCVLGRKTGVE